MLLSLPIVANRFPSIALPKTSDSWPSNVLIAYYYFMSHRRTLLSLFTVTRMEESALNRRRPMKSADWFKMIGCVIRLRRLQMKSSYSLVPTRSSELGENSMKLMIPDVWMCFNYFLSSTLKMRRNLGPVYAAYLQFLERAIALIWSSYSQ